MTPHVIDNRSIDTGTSDPISACTHDLAARNDGNVRRSATDVDDR